MGSLLDWFGSMKISLFISVSIAFSTLSYFFGLSFLASLVQKDSVLKSSILIVQKLALHQNGVEFRQQFNGSIRSSLTPPFDDIRRRARLKISLFFFFNPSPSSSRAILKEWQIWKLSVQMYCIIWLYSCCLTRWAPVYTFCTVRRSPIRSLEICYIHTHTHSPWQSDL